MAEPSNSIRRRRIAWIVVGLFVISALSAVLLRPKPNLFSAPALPEYESGSIASWPRGVWSSQIWTIAKDNLLVHLEFLINERQSWLDRVKTWWTEQRAKWGP